MATLAARHRFEGREVQTLLLDGAGHILAAHRPPWQAVPRSDGVTAGQMMCVLDGATLVVHSEVEVPVWATLREAVAGRALFQTLGGLLVIGLDDPAAPLPRAFFPTQGYPNRIRVLDRDQLVAAGRYGLYRLSLDATNLLGP